MKFRYYITDIGEGIVFGTDSEDDAKDYATSCDFFVIDASTGKWFTDDGSEFDIQDVKND